jgi:hypothetical protein
VLSWWSFDDATIEANLKEVGGFEYLELETRLNEMKMQHETHKL